MRDLCVSLIAVLRTSEADVCGADRIGSRGSFDFKIRQTARQHWRVFEKRSFAREEMAESAKLAVECPRNLNLTFYDHGLGYPLNVQVFALAAIKGSFDGGLGKRMSYCLAH